MEMRGVWAKKTGAGREKKCVLPSLLLGLPVPSMVSRPGCDLDIALLTFMLILGQLVWTSLSTSALKHVFITWREYPEGTHTDKHDQTWVVLAVLTTAPHVLPHYHKSPLMYIIKSGDCATCVS